MVTSEERHLLLASSGKVLFMMDVLLLNRCDGEGGRHREYLLNLSFIYLS